jgi:hypothetical protein
MHAEVGLEQGVELLDPDAGQPVVVEAPTSPPDLSSTMV